MLENVRVEMSNTAVLALDSCSLLERGAAPSHCPLPALAQALASSKLAGSRIEELRLAEY